VRKIVAGMFITLDGVVEAPQKWNPPYYDDEMSEAVQAQLSASDTHLYGRTLVRFLLDQGLLDELQLLLHPMLLGSGKHLFDPGGQNVPLRLLDSTTFTTGVVALRYARAA
jgi:dihydrofolate reductase